MYSLKNFKPYVDVLARREDLLARMQQAEAAITDGRTRLEELDGKAAEMAIAGPDGYKKYERGCEAIQVQIAQAQEDLRVFEAALALVDKEVGIQKRAAQAVIKQKAREQHGPIVERAAAAIEELAAALELEQGLVGDLRSALGPETGLPLLAWALPVRAAQLEHALAQIQGRR